MTVEVSGRAADIGPLHAFLGSRTSERWIEQALANLDLLLLDHASLELKAAQQAQHLIWKYGTGRQRCAAELDPAFRSQLVYRMSRLAREELRHFEQVVTLIERRGGSYAAVSPSRYAAGLHALARKEEPGALVDALIIGAIIEARSCERFECLVLPLETVDAELARLYASLLRSEARHFEGYLALARDGTPEDISARIGVLLERDAELIVSRDTELRFHSGIAADAAAD